MELHELHVLQRQPGPQRHRHAVAGAGVRVRGRRGRAGRRRRSPGSTAFAPIVFRPPLTRSQADHALAAPVLDDELPGEVLLVDRGSSSLHQLLVEHLDQHVAGDVGGVDGARRAGGAERALGDPAVLVAREDAAPVLELVDVAGRLAREDLDRVLVAEVVGALDRVERVDLGAVLGRVPERRVDAALGRAGVAARRVQLRDDGDVRARRRAPRSRPACRRSRRRRRPRRARSPPPKDRTQSPPIQAISSAPRSRAIRRLSRGRVDLINKELARRPRRPL